MAPAEPPMQKPAGLDKGLHLFWGSGSPFARRAQMAVLEKGLPCNYIKMEFSRGDTRTPWFKELTVRHQVPTLIHDGVVVNESVAILEYLERHGGGNPLLPADRKLQARALSLLHEVDSNLGKANGELNARTLFAKESEKFTKEQVEESAKKVYDELDVWEGHLTTNAKSYKGGWFVGDKVSVVDISLYPYISNYTERLGLKLVPRWSRLDKWNSQMSEKPSAQASKPPHWADSPPPKSPFKWFDMA
ncbi:hypothetical protein SmJEL517_g04775 [Synchytrium microbalum]|uniref:Glutathione transferase n=1 Tax=Synchytrium microbalum TaxID=1806994 RepID=A0A507C251_9FUNG|nr:uncharacterized protein SmJEL517_g04775 [Synchytrium microbalum]TPX32036.1 hypothetical protein SmJEL517_g04775 [Synchytrium microbalum]